MSASAQPRMTSGQFIDWAAQQPDGQRYELVAGEVVAMAPQRSGHALAAFHVARRLFEAVGAAGVPCTVYADGMAVEVDSATVYEPDAMVRCGAPLPADAVRATDPLIVVEVLSPSSRSRDAGAKLADYFRLVSLRHYLIVAADIRTVIHHARDEAGTILTRIVRDGPLRLDPPGLVLDQLFADAFGR
jgi:Uma2 family endonuclease